MKLRIMALAGLVYCLLANSCLSNRPQNKPAEPLALNLFVQKVMDICRASLSAGRKELLSRQIARIATDRITKRDHQEAFILLLCIESKFQENAKSKAGAIGLAQILPKYAQSFAADCGIPKITPEDTQSVEVNLHVGACYFNTLLIQFNGNTVLALSGYNSGPGSQTTRKLGLLQEGHPETGWYIAKITMLREMMDIENQIPMKEEM